MKPYLFIRGLRQADHTVFSVDNGQKTYRDPISGRPQPYSSGQQVKRSMIDMLVEEISDERRASLTFTYQLELDKDGKEDFKPKEVWNPCDPNHADQLIGGWMQAKSDSLTLKRRSPLSVSAMRPLHPSLANTSEEILTFDRSNDPGNHHVKVRNSKNEEIPLEQVEEFLRNNERSLPRRIWMPKDKVGPRAEGLFVYDIAIDLKRLFRVSTNQHEPELSPARIDELIENGWTKEQNKEFLLCPKERRDEIIEALAYAIVNWRITSNQSRTYSPQATLALAVSDNANLITSAIRADLREEGWKADPVIDHIDGVDLFIALSAKGYVSGITGAADAMVQAEDYIKEQLLSFPYA